MLKIGDFSKLAHVTVKALRYYAEMGLLKPTWIDRFTGYRYYDLDQLPRLNRILALKDLGFSLDQIVHLLDEHLSVEQMQGMLRRKQAELEARLTAEQNRLEMVAVRLRQIEQEGQVGREEVLVKRIEKLPIAALREVAPSAERMPQHVRRMVERLERCLDEINLRPTGPWLALFDGLEYRERNIPVEMGVVVAPEALQRSPAASRAGLSLRLLPPVEQMACLYHAGPPEALPQAYTGLYAWMEAHRFHPAGPARELYLRDEQAEHHGQVIEVQIPVERAGGTDLLNEKGRKETTMQPKIVNRPAFTVVGYCYHGKNQNQEIAKMWGEFVQRLGEIQTNNTYETFGVCLIPPGLPEGEFEYVAGMQTAEDAPVPEGMVKRTLPAYQYAVFEHVGALATLGETYRYIHEVGLPQAGLKPLESGLDMEVYDDRVFNDFSPESILYLYVPVIAR